MAKRLTMQQIRNLLRDLEFRPLKIKFEERKSNIASCGGDLKDIALLNIGWKSRSEKFIAEILGQATPKQIETGILRLEKSAATSRSGRTTRKSFLPLIIAPFLSEKTLARLAEAEISGIDLSGNGVVVIPDKLFIYRTGEKNKFLSNAPIKNIFRGTSSLAARVFLANPEYENVGEVLEEITRRGGRTTFSTVSKVLKTLEEELIIGKGERICLLDARRLLNELRENYRRPEVRRLCGKVGDLSQALKKMSKNAGAKNVLYVREDPAKYAVMPSGASIVKIYTESIDELLSGIELAETSRFPNIELIETDEQTVYFDRRKESEIYWSSPLETYLELANGGKREQETADGMVKKLLDFKY